MSISRRRMELRAWQNLLRCGSPLQKYFRRKFSLFGNKGMEYKERRLLGYSRDEMFHIVNDVENYMHFVPWCASSKIISRSQDTNIAKLSIGFPPLYETYTSAVTYKQPDIVKSVCTDGILFRHLVTVWKFSPTQHPRNCILDFSVQFEFKSMLHSSVAQLFFDEVAKTMVTAFLKRARHVYGPPSCDNMNHLQED